MIALLAGCSSKPQVTAQQESSRYLSRAHRNYTPPGPPEDPWGPYVVEASAKFDVPERWIREVMRQESGGKLYGRGGSLITSGAGAMGLMQVMPQTYDELRARYSELGDDPYDPHNNILAGTAYIREMFDIYGSPGFLAAYNAGPGRLDDYLTRNRTLPAETRRYVANIGPRIAGYEPRRASPGAQYAMNALPLDIPAGPRYSPYGTQYAAYSAPATPIVLNPPRPIVLTPPVQVAEAPAPSIKLSPPAPIQLAQTEERAGPFIKLSPQPVEDYAAAEDIPEPPPRARYAAPTQPTRVAALEPAHSLLAAAHRPAPTARESDLPLPEPPAPVPPPRASRFAQRAPAGTSRPIEVAEFAEPRLRSQREAASAELVALGPRPHTFSLIPSANAAPVHRASASNAPTSGGWAIQVGAFSSPKQASAATSSARERARELGAGRPMVATVRQSGATLYRARLGGLSHEAATRACERLSHGRTGCMVVSPSAQR